MSTQQRHQASGIITDTHAVIPQPFRRVLATTGSHEARLPWPATVVKYKKKKGWTEWYFDCKGQQHTCTHLYTTHTFSAFVRTFTNTIMSPGPTLNPTITTKPDPNLTQFYPEPPKQTFAVVRTKCSYFIKMSSLQMNRVFWSSLCRMYKNTHPHTHTN